MSSKFIEAMIAAAARAPAASLTVASDVRPGETTLGAVVSARRRMGTRMTASGIEPGDNVACMLPNWREWPVGAVAAAQAGDLKCVGWGKSGSVSVEIVWLCISKNKTQKTPTTMNINQKEKYTYINTQHKDN